MPGVAWGYQTWREVSLGLLSGSRLTLQNEERLFTTLAQPRPGESWLDVGTSSGFYAGVLARAGADILAIDIAPSMLKVARTRLDRHPDQSARVDWALIDIEESGLPDGCFDGIAVGATLNETARPWRALGEMQRLLAPGGRLWLMYLSRGGGAVQSLLSKYAGLTFADRAQVRRALFGCDRVAADVRRSVTFELYVRRT
ncbi:class I SAM-dependent methyltransferase [Deinococcus peraridilitoris]|uniref:class I SAM-dependent methyltransferase n=1 Tax=Deinococcus peraridilitoris TaxID=432329 RepID=UPI0012F7F289|nr:class I SAM-dependent methyltransferase [Deinococcus peraridilitoris]